MALESPRTVAKLFEPGLIVAVHLPVKWMLRIDAARAAQAIVFLPWLEREGQEWAAVSQPAVVGQISG